MRYTVTIAGSDGSQFYSAKTGIILDQNNKTFSGVLGTQVLRLY
jgi:hypothetical protein